MKSLPKPVRARLARTKLAGCSFEKQPRLQPALHLPCDSTNGPESYYIDFDGRTVTAIPAREDNFHPGSLTGEGPIGEPLIAPSLRQRRKTIRAIASAPSSSVKTNFASSRERS